MTTLQPGDRVRVRFNDRHPGPHAGADGTYPATVLEVAATGLSALVEYDHLPGSRKLVSADFATVELSVHGQHLE